MKIEHIRTGRDLYLYINELITMKQNISNYQFPYLLDYLLSLWTTAEKYKSVDKVSFSLIAQILEEALQATPKKVDWEELLKDQYLPPFNSEANTPEYYEEIAQYSYFEKNIRNYVVSLKMVVTYGMKRLGVPDYAERPDGEWGKYYWENHTTETFLERGVAFLEDEDDWYSDDPKNNVSWYTLKSILSEGRFEE